MHLAVPFSVDEAAAGDGHPESKVVTDGTGRRAGAGTDSFVRGWIVVARSVGCGIAHWGVTVRPIGFRPVAPGGL